MQYDKKSSGAPASLPERHATLVYGVDAMTLGSIRHCGASVKRTRIVDALITYSRQFFGVAFSVSLSAPMNPLCIFHSASVLEGRATLSRMDWEPSKKKAVKGKSLPTATKARTTAPGAVVLPPPSVTDVPQEDGSPSAYAKGSPARLAHEEELARMVVAKQEKRCHVARRDKDSLVYAGMSTVKGTKDYNRKARAKYSKKIASVLSSEGSKAFITVTANREQAGEGLRSLWEGFFAKLSLLVRRLVRDWGARYFYAVESDEYMRPHAHIVASLGGCYKSAIHYAKGNDKICVIVSCARWLTSYWQMGTVKVEPVDGVSLSVPAVPVDGGSEGSLAGYVTKELQCSIDDSARSVKSGGGTLSEYEQRAMNTLYFCELLGKKQFMGSKSPKDKPKEDKKMSYDVDEDLRVVEEASRTGRRTAETDGAFYRLLWSQMPEDCRREWFLLKRKDGQLVPALKKGSPCVKKKKCFCSLREVLMAHEHKVRVAEYRAEGGDTNVGE